MTDDPAMSPGTGHVGEHDADPLGRAPRNRHLRRRLLRHYLPIALASSVALVVFMNIAFFNANRYPPPADIMVEGFSGAIGKQGGTPMGPGMHGTDPSELAPADPAAGATESGVASTLPSEGPGGHGATEPGPMQHGADAATSSETATASSEPVVATDGVPEPTAANAVNGVPGDAELLMREYSTATGYIALALLALTLLVGPVNLMRRRRTPLSSYLARDVGLAAAVVSVAHVIFGFLTQHSDGILSYFFAPDDRTRILTTSFGLANWVGLGAVVIVATLAAISSDWALRALKAKRWKRIQRLNYLLFLLVVAHAVLYGALLRLTSPYTALLGVCVVAVVVGQGIGIRLWRQRIARRGVTVSAPS